MIGVVERNVENEDGNYQSSSSDNDLGQEEEEIAKTVDNSDAHRILDDEHEGFLRRHAERLALDAYDRVGVVVDELEETFEQPQTAYADFGALFYDVALRCVYPLVEFCMRLDLLNCKSCVIG